MNSTNPYASPGDAKGATQSFSTEMLTKRATRWCIFISLVGIIHFVIAGFEWWKWYKYCANVPGGLEIFWAEFWPSMAIGSVLFFLFVVALVLSFRERASAKRMCIVAVLATVALFILEAIVLQWYQSAILHPNWGREYWYMNWWWLDKVIRYGKFVF